MLLSRRLRIGVALASTFMVARPALGSDGDACVDAATEGQNLRDQGELIHARARFVTCAQASCPGIVASTCAQWLSEIALRIPSIVLRLEDELGVDVTDAALFVDAKAVSPRMTGLAMDLDPGPHRVRFEPRGRAPVEQVVVLAEGERARVIVVHLPPLPPPAVEPRSASGWPVGVWILGSAGVLAIGGSAALGVSVISDARSLRDSCGPRCPSSDKESLERRLVIADIALGLGVAALGVAAYLALTHRSASPQRAASSTSSKTMSTP
jgi:hypothetical protein